MAAPTQGTSPTCRSCRVAPCVHGCLLFDGLAPDAILPGCQSRQRRGSRQEEQSCLNDSLLTASGNFKPEHRDGGGVSRSRMSQALQPSSVDLHVFGDPFDAHKLKLLLGLPCAAEHYRDGQDASVLRPPTGWGHASVVLGTFTAPFTAATACLLASYPETCLHPISAGRSKYTQSLKHASPGVGRRQPTPKHTLPLETCRERASHCTSVSELIKTPPPSMSPGPWIFSPDDAFWPANADQCRHATIAEFVDFRSSLFSQPIGIFSFFVLGQSNRSFPSPSSRCRLERRTGQPCRSCLELRQQGPSKK